VRAALLLLLALGACAVEAAPDTSAARSAVLISDDLEIDGSATVGDQLQVYGHATLSTLGVGDVEAGGDLSVGGDVYRGAPHEITVPGSAALGGVNAPALGGLGVQVGWRLSASPAAPMSARAVVYPVAGLVAGDRLRGWSVLLDKRSSPVACGIAARMYRTGGPYDESPVGPGAVALQAGERWVGAAWTEHVEDGFAYYVVVTGCGWAADTAHALRITTDRPRP
jgi:hypothetical protein